MRFCDGVGEIRILHYQVRSISLGMERAFTYIEFFINSFAADMIGVGFIVGIVIFLVGILLIGLFSLSRLMGYRTPGVVVGAVERVRIKKRERDGEVEEEEKRSLYPVYEYTASDGNKRQMMGSEGGTMVHSYATGQSVQLIVREDDGYDDVYDADQYGALYLGFGLVATGLGIMAWVGSMASAFGVTILACVIAGILRIGFGLLGGKRKTTEPKERKPYNKAFDPADLKPVESFSR